MATKLYFRAAAPITSGTNLPSVHQGPWTTISSAYLASHSILRAIGSSQTSISPVTSGTTSLQVYGIGQVFVSDPLSGSQTVGGGTLTFNCANSEGNTSANWNLNDICVYVWRPGTNSLVGKVVVGATSSGGLGGAEPSAASSEQVNHWTTTSSGIAAQDGDVIVVEIGAAFTQSMSSSYGVIFYYDGTTENTTSLAVVTSQASFIQFAETLLFQTDPTPSIPNKIYSFTQSINRSNNF